MAQNDRTRLDEWQFATADLGLSRAELTTVLALARFMDEATLEAFPGLATLAELAGCDATKIKRGLRGLIRRGALIKNVGGGRGKLTTYIGRIVPAQTGSIVTGECDPVSEAAARSETGSACPMERDPVSVAVLQEGVQPKTGSETGSKQGQPRGRATVEHGTVEPSLSFASGGSPAATAPEPRSEIDHKVAQALAKAFLPVGEMKARPCPTMADVLKERVALIRASIAAGQTSEAELTARLAAWRPYWQHLHAENGHAGGQTLRSWLAVMRDDPSERYDWTPPHHDDRTAVTGDWLEEWP